jgi:heat shock protein HtpX
MTNWTQQGIEALKAGRRADALRFLSVALQENPDDLTAWLWISGALETDQQRADALGQVLRLDPSHQAALRGLAELAERSVKPQDLTADEEEPQPSIDNSPTVPSPRRIAELVRAPLEVNRRPSLAGRATLALLLTLGFYLLALSVAGLLLFVIYAEFALLGRINLQITLGCGIGAIAILWSILPRFERFKVPGARLQPEDHPLLFKLIQSVAQRMDQELPKEVYLIAEVNAFVAEVGGFLGLGTHRILALGLPMLEGLTVPQLRAVLAHEFGHYYAGDTRLGPWIYRVRKSILRTVINLGSQSLIQAPFRWYARLFLRITQSISRRQELVADELAAQVAGSQAAIEGLTAVHGLDAAFRAYWEKEFLPVLSKGFHPPLGEGFSHFIHTENVSEAITHLLEQQTQNTTSDPFDSHPSLKERLDALQAMPSGPLWKNHNPAINLLEVQPGLEQELLKIVYGPDKTRELKAVDWQTVGNTVYLPIWQDTIRPYQPALADFTSERLPEFRGAEGKLANLIKEKSRSPLKTEDLVRTVDLILAMTLAICLAADGWGIQALPGEEVLFVKEGDQLAPFLEVNRLAKGELGLTQWQYLCEDTGIAGKSCF